MTSVPRLLRFGDARGYNATLRTRPAFTLGCGLVMKEDITQQVWEENETKDGCGLVMKEDITQQQHAYTYNRTGCGLVMKEDITQRQQPVSG